MKLNIFSATCLALFLQSSVAFAFEFPVSICQTHAKSFGELPNVENGRLLYDCLGNRFAPPQPLFLGGALTQSLTEPAEIGTATIPTQGGVTIGGTQFNCAPQFGADWECEINASGLLETMSVRAGAIVGGVQFTSTGVEVGTNEDRCSCDANIDDILTGADWERAIRSTPVNSFDDLIDSKTLRILIPE